MKPGGYSDSGADIAYTLKALGVSIVTPAAAPDPTAQLDWVFPDTSEGIERALSLGATTLWANTILFKGHPLEETAARSVRVVGQLPTVVHQFDDKWTTNQLLRRSGLPVARSVLVGASTSDQALAVSDLTESRLSEHGLSFPLMLKPVRGRGSEAVTKVEDFSELVETARDLIARTVEVDGVTYSRYGSSLILEEYVPGTEITMTVMPPGVYQVQDEWKTMNQHWALPPVERFNHVNGIAPYNGEVAVVRNSRVVPATPALRNLAEQSAVAARLIGAVAPIRIDCRQSPSGQYLMFDLNMKPNMTGAGRPGREDQDSLSCMAAREIGWSYGDLLVNMLRQAWAAVAMRQGLDSD
jgi:hypothetical protein